jgi:hypothetical protein
MMKKRFGKEAMNPTITFKGKQTNGKLVIYAPGSFSTHLRGLGHGDLDIVVKRHKEQRSKNQNDYYWAVVVTPLAEYLGWDPDDLHEFYKANFFAKRATMKAKGGVNIEALIPRSTTELKTDEYEEVLDVIRRWAKEFHDFDIPLPNEGDNVRFG